MAKYLYERHKKQAIILFYMYSVAEFMFFVFKDERREREG